MVPGRVEIKVRQAAMAIKSNKKSKEGDGKTRNGKKEKGEAEEVRDIEVIEKRMTVWQEIEK